MMFKRAVILGLIVYLISFVIGMVVAVGMGVDFDTAAEVPTNVWIINIIIAVIIVALASLYYFRTAIPGAKEGLKLGLIFMGVGFAIDAFLVLPFIIMSESPADIAGYYSNPLFWLTILVIIGETTKMGWIAQKYPKLFKRFISVKK